MAAKDDINNALTGSGFTLNPSATAQSNIFIAGVGSVIDDFEAILNEDKENITELSQDKKIGTLKWYAETSKEFQEGYNLSVDDEGNAYYATIDESAQIVTSAAAIENNDGSVTIKLAKTGTTDLEPLTPTELNDFTGYITNLKMAGTRLNLVSVNPDTITYNITVKSDGRYSETDLTENIETALNGVKNNLPFDGVIYLSDVVLALENVDGVVNVDLSNSATDLLIWTDTAGNTSAVSDSKPLTAGYFVYDENSILNVV